MNAPFFDMHARFERQSLSLQTDARHLAIRGRSGIGKSRLLRIVAGLLDATGRLRVGARIFFDDETRLPPNARRAALVPQDAVLFPHLDVRGNLGFAKGVEASAIEEVAAWLELTELLARAPRHLSGGEKQRVALGRALLSQPELLLLDEPFTGVDVKTEEAIIKLLRSLREEGRVMLVSTHNLGSVPEFCDRTILVKGTVLAYGPTEMVFTRNNLERAFGGVLRHFTLGGTLLHDDDDHREVSIITDDERPFVHYGETIQRSSPAGEGQ